MKDKNFSEGIENEFKEHQNSASSKIILSKFDYELFDEEKNTPSKVYRVKRISLPNKGEKWKIFEDSKNIFTIEGVKLTNKEKEYLRSVDGILFLMNEGKKGIKSLKSLKDEIKKYLK